ncbi:MAG: FAD-dependent oxidoreductase [Victivallaceae bacterium]|nr:FAD-dependent oxidoreductase [Victivallaceae bacterium]
MSDGSFDIIEVVIIGGGAAGLSAGRITAAAGLTTAVIERDSCAGGILNQCIHNGFGLRYFREELTGPEYAEKAAERATEAGCRIFTDTTVLELSVSEPGNGKYKLKKILCCSPEYGVMEFFAKSVILAMGSRERSRGNLAISGHRPAGVFTAGAVQRLMNINGYVPGKEAVIIGSGDVGLIMARRLSWAGVKVKGVVEIMPYPAGLPRNIAQCLEDFDIPLHLSCRTMRINGRHRVESVDIAPLENGRPVLNRAFSLSCDTVLMSVGLIPENELSKKAGVALNPVTGGPVVDSRLMTGIDGIFACGNVLHIHDLADYVSAEAETAGKHVIEYLGGKVKRGEIKTLPGAAVRYVIPGGADPASDNTFYMRSAGVMERARINIHQDGRLIYSRPLKYVKPAEMLKIELPQAVLKESHGSGVLEFSLLAG